MAKFKASDRIKVFFQLPEIEAALKKGDMNALLNNAEALGIANEAVDVLFHAGINPYEDISKISKAISLELTVDRIDLSDCTDLVQIGAQAFSHCPNLKEVIIGDSVRSIEAQAFMGCPKLSSVILGDGLLSIGKSAFTECPNLHRLDLPESVRVLEANALHANDDCYIFSPPRKRGTLKVKGDMEWLRTHLGVDPRYRQDAEAPVEEE